jgi:formate dehydrogenase major subunit
VRISKEDAALLGVTDGDKIKISSRVGSIKLEITIDDSLEKRILVAPYHFEKMLVNKLAPLELDPVSGTPCYKRISVNVKAVDK